MKKTIISIVAILLIGVVVFIVYKNKAVAPNNNNAVPSTNESVSNKTNPPLTETEAKTIAQQTCIKEGESLEPGNYDAQSKSWWFDAHIKSEVRPDCAPACVVNVETKTAKIDLRCPDLPGPMIICPTDVRPCPDGSFVSRSGPNCEFATCQK